MEKPRQGGRRGELVVRRRQRKKSLPPSAVNVSVAFINSNHVIIVRHFKCLFHRAIHVGNAVVIAASPSVVSPLPQRVWSPLRPDHSMRLAMARRYRRPACS